MEVMEEDGVLDTNKVAERFAQLIINECAEVAGCNFHVSGFELGFLIREHFEVDDES